MMARVPAKHISAETFVLPCTADLPDTVRASATSTHGGEQSSCRAPCSGMFDWLEQRLRAAHELTDAMDGVNFVDDLRGPAAVDAIERCEAALEQFLPDSYRQFLKLHDGGFLGLEVAMATSTFTSGIQIFSAGECAEATSSLAEDLAPFELPIGALDGLIVFASYGNSDIVYLRAAAGACPNTLCSTAFMRRQTNGAKPLLRQTLRSGFVVSLPPSSTDGNIRHTGYQRSCKCCSKELRPAPWPMFISASRQRQR